MTKFFIKSLNLKEGEEIVQVVRQYLLTYFLSFLLSAILIIAPFFFLYLLFSLGVWGIVIFLFSLFLGIFYGLRKLIIWYFNIFVITNQRIIDIDQRGFFDRIVSEAPYGKVEGVSYRIKGLIKTLFHYGNIQIQIVGSRARIELKNIRFPEKIQELILSLIEENKEKQQDENFDQGEKEEGSEAKDDFEIIKKKIYHLNENQLKELNDKIKEELRNKAIRSLNE